MARHKPSGHLETIVTEPERARLARYRLGLDKNVRAFLIGSCRVLLAHSPQADHYLAISRKNRYPTWEEVLRIRDLFFSGPTKMGALARPPGERVGVPAHTLELWEMTQTGSKPVYDARGKVLGTERSRA